MAKNPYEHENSIDAHLMELPEHIRIRYERNRIKYFYDYVAMEEWAASGCTAGGVESDRPGPDLSPLQASEEPSGLQVPSDEGEGVSPEDV